MISEKIKDCRDAINDNYGKVVSESIKYLDTYGFASTYFKVEDNGRFYYFPVMVVPDKESDKEEYSKFISFLKEVGLYSFMIKDGVLDIDSVTNILWFAEGERFKMSGKKSMHEDLSEDDFPKTIRDIIDERFEQNTDIRCFFDKKTRTLITLDASEIEYFEEARKFLGI